MDFVDEKDFLSFITIKRGLAFQSVRHCMIRIRVINAWLNGRELTEELIEEFFLELKNKGLKNSTLNTYYFVFRQIKEYQKDRNKDNSFLDGFKSFKKTQPQIIIFTQEEIEKILSTSLKYGKLRGKDCSFLDFRYGTLTMFIAYTGCRFEEATTLKVKYVDLSAGKLQFVDTKTNENRTNYFIEPLKSRLKELIKSKGPDELVFRNSLENQINPQDFSVDVKRRAVKAGVTKRTFPHNFRHSYITHLLEEEVPITEVATLVGHKDIQTTYKNYMHLADKTLERAALRHPLLRKNVDPMEIIKDIKERIDGFHLTNDNRFVFSKSETERGYSFSVEIKN